MLSCKPLQALHAREPNRCCRPWACGELAFIRRFLETRLAQYFGRISFAIYIVHGPVLALVQDFIIGSAGTGQRGAEYIRSSYGSHRLRQQRARQHADSDPADNELVYWSAKHKAYHCLGDRPILDSLTSQRCTLPDGSRHSAWMPPTERRRGSRASGHSRPDDCPAMFARSLFAKRPRRSHAL